MGLTGTDRPQTPEEAFVVAIIMQAYRDLFMPIQKNAASAGITQLEQDQAISFLTDHQGAFARHRNDLCSLIGWDGDVLAACIRRMMEGEEFPIVSDKNASSFRKHLQGVERVRVRWKYLKSPPKRPSSSVEKTRERDRLLV
ncbi:hypothetical protein [Ruegeria atlantica]|uniref:hypothetical protein n=1 Tax=Ruegeria atlantica TaxID=81569 RepID=UPI00147BDC7B|nr:hypothetical protein [Ruegeria atlantica]